MQVANLLKDLAGRIVPNDNTVVFFNVKQLADMLQVNITTIMTSLGRVEKNGHAFMADRYCVLGYCSLSETPMIFT